MTPVLVEQGDSPVILGLPHTGTWLPPEIFARLNARGRVLALARFRIGTGSRRVSLRLRRLGLTPARRHVHMEQFHDESVSGRPPVRMRSSYAPDRKAEHHAARPCA